MKRFYLKLQLVGALVIVGQALVIWIDIGQLLHFSDHPAWLQFLNCLVVVMAVVTIYRMGHTMGGAYRDWKEHKATMAKLRALGEQLRARDINGPDEMEAYVRELEALDPEFGADIRKNMKDFLPK
ncbi:hypothetical protein [Paraburkholderia youngii]|uniref:hypothetical protein n=1 Tax=Paraburkholderia youngii TaxID=2782701 RepID=UPI0015915C26|nr:hypothetical protein [Paraburkholderia youngii]NUX58707.1 hypothetical protein [Paraburkholderia youngii]